MFSYFLFAFGRQRNSLTLFFCAYSVGDYISHYFSCSRVIMASNLLGLVLIFSVISFAHCKDVVKKPAVVVKPNVTISPLLNCTSQPNMVYYKNKPSCPQTCDSLNYGCFDTPKPLVSVGGCACKPGYVLNSKQKCVEGNNFCGNCTAHEYFTPAGPACQTTCKTLGKRCDIVHKRAPSGCYCNPGYARNEKGKCIPIEQCPKRKCQYKGEEFLHFGTCEGSCQNPLPKCAAECQAPGCYCKPNYVRKGNGCIPFENCPKLDCPLYEQFYRYGIQDGTCEHPYTDGSFQCSSPGCYCAPGNVRDVKNNCIPIQNCTLTY